MVALNPEVVSNVGSSRDILIHPTRLLQKFSALHGTRKK